MDFKTQIEARLAKPFNFPWRSHGIGMLRTYLDEAQTVRLNIWHHRLVNPGISLLHTHPWVLHSNVIAGELRNQRFIRANAEAEGAIEMIEDTLPCGHATVPEFALSGQPHPVWLVPQPPEVIGPGYGYTQQPEEIHSTDFLDGTVTVMTRSGFTEDGMASVFWEVGGEWGDASRDTTTEDIVETISAARARMQFVKP